MLLLYESINSGLFGDNEVPHFPRRFVCRVFYLRDALRA